MCSTFPRWLWAVKKCRMHRKDLEFMLHTKMEVMGFQDHDITHAKLACVWIRLGTHLP